MQLCCWLWLVKSKPTVFPCTAVLSGYRATRLSILLATSVKWNYRYFSKAVCLACYTGNSDEILQLCCEADHLFCFWPCSLGKARKSAFLFPQSLFKLSAMSLESFLCYFSRSFSIVHAQLASSSHWMPRLTPDRYMFVHSPILFTQSTNQSNHLTYSAPLPVTAPGRSISAVLSLMHNSNCTEMRDSCIMLQPYPVTYLLILLRVNLMWGNFSLKVSFISFLRSDGFT